MLKKRKENLIFQIYSIQIKEDAILPLVVKLISRITSNLYFLPEI